MEHTTNNQITISSARHDGEAVIVTASDGREFAITQKAGNLYSHVEIYSLRMHPMFGNTREVCILRKSTTASARRSLGKMTHFVSAAGCRGNTGTDKRNGSAHLRSIEIQ